jgi:hypothetical protein
MNVADALVSRGSAEVAVVSRDVVAPQPQPATHSMAASASPALRMMNLHEG